MKSIVVISGLHIWSLGEKMGAGSFYQTIKGYSDHGYTIDLITCARSDGLDLPGINYHHCILDRLDRLGSIRKVGFLFRMIKWMVFQVYATWKTVGISHKKPAAVYAYEHFGVPGAMLAGKILNTPVVTRFQGTVMKPRMTNLLWRIRYWDQWIGLRARANLVIMANDGTQGDQVLSAFGVPTGSVRFWMNGVNMPRIDYTAHECAEMREQLGIEKDIPVLLTVSRLVGWKRLDRIINAMPDILRKCPNVRLVVVGDGDSRQDYERLARQLNLENVVIFVGAIRQSDVAQYLAIADIFVSLYDLSNVGNPLLEAMSAGKCIITINNGGTGSIIENDINGTLLERDELDDLSNQICKLLLDKERRLRLGRCAKEYALTHFQTWVQRMELEISEIERLLLRRTTKKAISKLPFLRN